MNIYTQNTGERPLFLRRISAVVMAIFLISQTWFGADSARAASTWNPTLIVNTEGFQIIDDADTTANVEVRFGQTLNEKLTYDRTNARFKFSRSLYVGGTLTTTGAAIINVGNTSATPDADVALEVIGTASGRVIHAQNTISSSGTIALENAANGGAINMKTGTGNPNSSVSGTLGSLYFATDTGKIWKNNNGTTQWVELSTGSGTTHMAKMRRDVAQSIPNITPTKLLFDTEEFDVGDIADPVTNNRFTIRKAGKYLVSGKIAFAGIDDAENTSLTIYKNNAQTSQIVSYSPAAGTTLQAEVVDVLDLVPGDYLELYVYQNDGGANDTPITEHQRPRMSVIQLQDNLGSSMWTLSGSNLYNNNSGNVGIGTSDPRDAKLEVVGTMSGANVYASTSLRSSGSLVADGNLTIDGSLTFGDALGDAVTANAATWTFANDTNFVLSGGANGLSFDTSTLSIDASADRVGVGTIAPKTKLEVAGTASGTNLYAANSLTGSHLYATTTFKGAGLSNCTGAGNKLTWLSATKQFACETDETGAATTTLQEAYDNDVDGSDATIALTSGDDSVIISNPLASGSDSAFALQVDQNADAVALDIDSEATTAPALRLDIAGDANSPHIQFGESGVFDTVLYRSAADTLRTEDAFMVDGSLTFGDMLGDIVTVNATAWTFANDTNFDLSGGNNGLSFDTNTLSIDANDNRVGIGTTVPATALDVVGTVTATDVNAASSVTGAHLYASTTIAGGGLADCTGTTNKLTWLSATKQFACETDETGGAAAGIVDHYVRAGGDSMTGGLLIESRASGTAPATIDAGVLLEVRGTASGVDLFAQKSLRSSGSLVADGNLTIDGSLTFGDALGDAVTANAATWTFANDTNFVLSGGANGLSFDTSTLSIDANADRVGIGTIAPKTKLEVLGVSSGTNLYAANSLTGSHLYATTTFKGAGLSDCTGAANKLTWLSATKQFACETDQGGAGGGLDYPTASTYFVNDGGDTMTGGLLIESRANGTPGTIEANVLLEVAGTASGRDLFAEKSLRSSGSLVLRPSGAVNPTLYANGSQKVGIMTGSPHSNLTASGSFATATTIMTSTGSINGQHQVVFASGSVPITLTLPTAVGINGRQYTIKKVDTALNNFVTIAPQSGQHIDGLTSWILYNRGQELTIASNGSNWLVANETKYSLYGYNAKGTTLNQWYGSPSNGTALTTAALTATATIRALPFITEKVITIDAMSVSVQTTAVSAEVRMGIFRDNGNGYPGKLIVDAGTVVTTSTGQRSVCPSGCTAVSTTLPVTIQPGLYWLAVNNNGIAHTLRGYAVGGLNPITGHPVNYTTTRNLGWNIANTYAAFPATFPGGASATVAAPLAAVTVRILK